MPGDQAISSPRHGNSRTEIRDGPAAGRILRKDNGFAGVISGTTPRHPQGEVFAKRCPVFTEQFGMDPAVVVPELPKPRERRRYPRIPPVSGHG